MARLGDYISEECHPVGAESDKFSLVGVSNEHGLVSSPRASAADDLSRYQRVKRNWFAYNPMRVNVGSIGLADDDSKTGITSPDYAVFSCRDGLDPRFLLHFLKSDYGLEAIARNCSGAVRKRLYYSGLAEIELAIPDIKRQQELITRIEHIQQAIRFIHDQNSDSQDLPHLKQAILQEAISGKLTADWRAAHPDVESARHQLKEVRSCQDAWITAEVANENREATTICRKRRKIDQTPPKKPDAHLPETWEWATLFDAALLVIDCYNKTPPYVASGIPLIRTTNVRNGRIDVPGAKRVSEKTYKTWSARCVPQPGDLIFTREAPVGEVGIIPKEETVCLGQRTMLIRPAHKHIRNDYLLLAIRAPEFLERAAAFRRGAMVGHLRVGDVERAFVPVPPLAEQAAIVERVELLMEHCRALESEIAHTRTHAAHLLQAVLKEAFAPAAS